MWYFRYKIKNFKRYNYLHKVINKRLFIGTVYVISYLCNYLGVADVLDKPKLCDNFFQIGGNSINAVMVVSRINKHFPLSTEQFLKAKTLEEILHIVCDTNASLPPEMFIQERIKVSLKRVAVDSNTILPIYINSTKSTYYRVSFFNSFVD